MDEKTERLRDIFVDVTDGETVTESQSASHGSLAPEDDGERLVAAVAAMREALGVEADLDDEALATVVRRFYAGDDDAAIAEAVGADREAARRVRLDLHLLRESDEAAPFEFAAFASAVAEGADDAALAERFGVDAETAARYRRVVDARGEMRRVNRRYRDEFESVLADRELVERLTGDPNEGALDGATEGQEVDVSF